MEAEGGVAVAGVEVCYGADQEGVWGRCVLRLYFSRVCSAVPPPASQGAALAGEAAAEQHEQGQGRHRRHQDVEPALGLQLGPTSTQAAEEQNILEPLGLARLVSVNDDNRGGESQELHL